MGIMITGAVVPLALALVWSKQNLAAVISAPIISTVLAIIAWLVCAKKLYGTVDIDTTGADYPMLAGNVVALLMPIPICLIFTAFAPDNFNFDKFKMEIDVVENEEGTVKKMQEGLQLDEKKLTAGSEKAAKWSVILTVLLIIVWPLPLYFSGYIFTKGFFRGWVAFSIMWVWWSILAVVIYPIYENFSTIQSVMGNMAQDLCGSGYVPPAREKEIEFVVEEEE